ncbi:MAG: hypothetical protein IJT97_03345, partial [Bacteroidaceae bacterium]|nr:hypothetical protein [Bacteroidaceae bacterium]
METKMTYILFFEQKQQTYSPTDRNNLRTFCLTKSNLRRLWFRTAMLFVLFLAGSVGDKVWGADYKYIIINNKGQECFNYTIYGNTSYNTIDKTKLCVHPRAKSIFASDFRFYTDKSDAVADANGSIGSYHSEGTTITDLGYTGNQTFYVRYSMASNPAYDLTGKTWYYIQIRERNNKGGKRRQVYYDATTDNKFEFGSPGSNDTDIPLTNLQKSDEYLFAFVANGDPYDICIINREAAKSVNGGVMSVPGISRDGNNKDKQVVSYQARPSNYDPATTSTLQSFFLASGDGYLGTDWKAHWEGKYFVVGAMGGDITYWIKDGNDGSNGEAHYPYILCAMGSTGAFSDPGYQLQCFQSWRNLDTASNNTAVTGITPVETQNVTYKIVNKAGIVAICQTVEQGPSFINDKRTFELQVPADIVSPLISSGSIRYYKTLADAIAGTDPITEMYQEGATDIYVTYDYDTSNTLIDLSLDASYYMQVGGQWATASDNTATGTATNSQSSVYEWKLSASNDPYDITLTNNSQTGKHLGSSTPTTNGTNTAQFTDNASPLAVSKFILLGGNDGGLVLTAATGTDITTAPFAYLGCTSTGEPLRLLRSDSYPPTAGEVQINFESTNAKFYTYRIYDNTTNSLAIEMQVAGVPGATPRVPAAIRAAFVESYEYYRAGTSTPLTELPNENCVIDVKNYVVTATPALDLTGTQYYNMQVAGNYASVSGSSIALQTTLTKSRPYTWALDGGTNMDPYHITLRNGSNGSLLTQTFILTNGAAEGLYELLQATGNNTKAYLGTSNNSTAVIATEWTDGSPVIQLTFSIPVIEYSYVVVNLSNKPILQSQIFSNSSGTPCTLVEAFRSPLVGEYIFCTDYDDSKTTSTEGCTGNLQGVLPAFDGVIYVRYVPLSLDNMSIKLDGSDSYAIHAKNNPESIIGNTSWANSSVRKHQNLNYQPSHYRYQFEGRMVNNQYDPYDVAIYKEETEQYLTADFLEVNGTKRLDERTLASGSRTAPDRFMIVNGQEGYIEMIRVKCQSDTYYTDNIDKLQYIYTNSNSTGDINTGQGSSYVHRAENLQLKLTRPYTYQVLTLNGKRSLAAAEARTVEPDVTTPAMPDNIISPLIDNYKFYDATQFNVSSDGTYTLKNNATPLEYVSDATTNEIFVTYDKTDVKTDINLSGQVAYSIVLHTTKLYTCKYVSGGNPTVLSNTMDPGDEAINSDDNIYLWQLKGGDPYDVQIVSAAEPTRTIYYNGNANQWFRLLNVGTNPTAYNKFALLRGNGTNGHDYRMMLTQWNKSWGEPDLYHHFCGSSGRGNRVGLNYEDPYQGGGTSTNYNSDGIQMKLTPRRVDEQTYIVVSSDGTPLVSYTMEGTTEVAPNIPDPIKSPCVTNYTYYNAATGGEIVSKTTNGATIYVRYEYDPEAMLDMLYGTSYNLIVNENYVYANGATSVASTTSSENRTESDHVWTIEGGDPYQAIFKTSYDGNDKYLTYNPANELSLTDSDPAPFMILLGTNSAHVELMATRGKNASGAAPEGYANVGYDSSLKLYDQTEADRYTPQLCVLFRKLGTPITWHILDRTGREAISYTERYPEDLPTLDYDHVPTAICSPYIKDETLKFYTTVAENGTAADGRTIYIPSDEISGQLTLGATNVYVTYTTEHLMEKPLHLRGVRAYNMRINGVHIYDQSGSFAQDLAPTDDELTEDKYMWHFYGGTLRDPYAVQVKNVKNDKLFVYDTSTPGLSLGTSETNTYFILMQYADHQEDDGQSKIRVELMAATGENLASEKYYSVGRENSNPALYRSTEYRHGDDHLKILLNVVHMQITYHLIDKQEKILISKTVTATEGENDELCLPDDLMSPLVNTYHYWTADKFMDDQPTGIYKLNDGLTVRAGDNPGDELGSIFESDGQIYVTYNMDGDVKGSGDEGYIDLNVKVQDFTKRVARSETDASRVRDASDFGHLYMLQFLNGEEFYHEDGHDALETTKTPAMYPYSNGDGAMYIYGQEKWDNQKENGASTRTRWPWFLVSPNNDPYHVVITSWQNTHAVKADNISTNYYSFLRTYYNTTLGEVITANVTDDPRQIADGQVYSEYMLLGTAGAYKLLTTEPVSVGSTNERYYVHNFEQYWKNSPTVEGLVGSNPAANDPTLTSLGWHSYEAWANSAPWGGGSKTFGKSAHWFQTIEMGETFDLIPTSLDAILVLLDNHGWEIMRQTIAKPGEENYEAWRTILRKYDSPMVAAYHFYTTGSKEPGYHKYKVSNQADKTIITSLANYPLAYKGGALQDLYVTYDVKEDYAVTYSGAVTEADVQTSQFLVRQGGNYATATDASTIGTTSTIDISGNSPMLWTLKPNFNIDAEMAYKYLGDEGAQENAQSKVATEQDYYDEGRNGFDPYNIQLQNCKYKTYLTVQNVTNSILSGGSWTATYDGEMAVALTNLTTTVDGQGYDNTTLQMTGGTFMAVQDANGNMRLMPRFDHQHVMENFTLENEQAEPQPAGDEIHAQTTLLDVPTTYHIIDNTGAEAIQMSVSRGIGHHVPDEITSPLVKTFYYHTTQEHAANAKTRTTTNLGYMPRDIYVSYDFDTSKKVKLGNRKYFIKIGGMYVNANGTQTRGASALDEESTTQWLLYTEDKDPYRITLKPVDDRNKYLGSNLTTLNGTANNLVLGSNSRPVQRFCLLNGDGTVLNGDNGKNGNYVLAAATGATSGNTTYPYAYLSCTGEGNQIQLVHATEITPSTASVQVVLEPTPITYIFKVINLSNNIAITAKTKELDPGDHPEIPAFIKSPLATDFRYYTTTEILEGSGGVCSYQTGKTVADSLQSLPEPENWDDNPIIYVRYQYDNTKSSIDLSGRSVFNISNTFTDNKTRYLYVPTPGEEYAKVPWIEQADNSPELTTEKYLWEMIGTGNIPDPYNIQLATKESKDNYPDKHLTHRIEKNNTELNNTTNGWISTRLLTKNYGQIGNAYSRFYSFIIVDGDYEGTNKLLAACTDGTYGSEKDIYWYLGYQGKIEGNHQGGVFWRRSKHSDDKYVNIKFIPKNLVNITYHLTRQITGEEMTTREENKVCKTDILPPNEWIRKYCDYTFKCRYNAEDHTYDENYPFVEINQIPLVFSDDVDDPLAPVEIHVYIDYTVRDHGHTDAEGNDDGIPFNLMANTRAEVETLLDSENGFAENLFDLTSYEKKIARIGEHQLRRCDYLYFMVLNTNNNYSKGKQYFLRREDNGRISWLDNDYQPHAANSQNINGWDYNRCAESYRESDHAAFEDKKWLWCFAGDPYDMYIYNINAVVHEEYNPISHITESHTHRDHMTGFKKLSNSEFAVYTEDYTETAPAVYRWGLVNGMGDNADETFGIVGGMIDGDGNYDPNINNKQLYWTMSNSSTDKATEVLLKQRAEDFTGLDYNIKVLPYEPLKYEDVNFVIRRDDNLAGTRTTGTQELYYAADDRMFVEGDVIRHYNVGEAGYDVQHGDMVSLPWTLQRQFCKYTIYPDNTYTTPGNITITKKTILSSADNDGKRQIILLDGTTKDEDEYTWTTDEDGISVCTDWNPQRVYVKYEVTSDFFLKKHPTKAEVAEMATNNDHVYFMDFTDDLSQEGYDKGHHAYFDETATFQEQIGTLHDGVSEKRIWNGSTFVDDTNQRFNFCQFKTTTNRMESVPENLKWYFVGDPYAVQVYCTEDAFNKESVTLNEYTYPVGTLGSNLCRFDPTESKFQFVVDCVHLRTPAPEPIDTRPLLDIYDQATGEPTGQTMPNPNEGKPYYSPFYWEVVPAYSDRDGAFALRFKANNTILGYTNVYYYLAHDGKTRIYKESTEENPKSYRVNLSYDEDNHRHDRSKYIGYHKANDKDCVIRLVHPTKLYVSAYKTNYNGDPVVKEELSEYFGLGETLTDVPRHLKRKYVKYSNWQYFPKAVQNAADYMPTSLNFSLSEANTYNLEVCKNVADHTVSEWVFRENLLNADGTETPTKSRASFKLRVTYDLDDETSNGIHLFSSSIDNPTWLDVKVGSSSNSGWLYYDKTKKDATTGIENQTTLVSNFSYSNVAGQKNGWSTGLKGLHWAFIGDPYEFKVINRRRWEDEGAVPDKDYWLGTNYGQNKNQENVKTGRDTNTGKDIYEKKQVYYDYLQLGDTDENGTLSTLTYYDETTEKYKSPYEGIEGHEGYGQNGNTTWGLIYCKTGGVNDFFMRSASKKTTSPGDTDETNPDLVGDYSNKYVDAENELHNLTNDYERLIPMNFSSTSGKNGAFVTIPFSLETKTSDISKVTIRTVTELDDDGAANDCFDANVRIYNEKGEQKAVLKHVEVVYGDVFDAMPYTLRRYG